MAAALDAHYVPEALREFVDLRGRPPNPGEQHPLLMEQCRRIDTAVDRLIDTAVDTTVDTAVDTAVDTTIDTTFDRLVDGMSLRTRDRPRLRAQPATDASTQPGAQRRQISALAAPTRRRSLIICDPSPWMTAIYSLQYFADSSLFAPAAHAMRAIAQRTNGQWLHLLCADDLPWEADGLQRDGPQQRAATGELLVRHPPAGCVAPLGVSGDACMRLQRALEAVDAASPAQGPGLSRDRHMLHCALR